MRTMSCPNIEKCFIIWNKWPTFLWGKDFRFKSGSTFTFFSYKSATTASKRTKFCQFFFCQNLWNVWNVVHPRWSVPACMCRLVFLFSAEKNCYVFIKTTTIRKKLHLMAMFQVNCDWLLSGKLKKTLTIRKTFFH